MEEGQPRFSPKIIRRRKSDGRKPLLEVRKINVSPEVKGLKRPCLKWTKAEDTHLKHLVMDRIKRTRKGYFYDDDDEENLLLEDPANLKIDWGLICKQLGTGRSESQCATRWLKVLSPSLVKGQWRPEEDQKIMEMVAVYGPRKWTLIASKLKGRIGKQCRERWHNHLDPSIDKSQWRPEEDQLIHSLHEKYGNQWSKISKFLPGRTDNAIKNHWNCSLKLNKSKKSNRKAYTRKRKKEEYSPRERVKNTLSKVKRGSLESEMEYSNSYLEYSDVLNENSLSPGFQNLPTQVLVHTEDGQISVNALAEGQQPVMIGSLFPQDMRVKSLPSSNINLCVKREPDSPNVGHRIIIGGNTLDDDNSGSGNSFQNLRNRSSGGEMFSGGIYKGSPSPDCSPIGSNPNLLMSIEETRARNERWSLTVSPKSLPRSSYDSVTTPTPLKRVFSEFERRQRQRSFGSPTSVLLEDVAEHILDETRISQRSEVSMMNTTGVSEDLMAVETPSKALSSYINESVEAVEFNLLEPEEDNIRVRYNASARKSLSGIFYDLG